jgi:hypothetical protein
MHKKEMSMILNSDGRITPSDDMQSFADGNRTLWWRGLLFIKGLRPGDPSIIKFFQLIDEIGLASACDQISGNFVAVLQDQRTGHSCLFTDNNRVSNAFYARDIASTSLLQLLPLIKPTAQDLDPEAVLAFIITGQVYSPYAFFKTIRFLNADEILVAGKDGFTVVKKELRNIYDIQMSRQDLYDNLSEIVKSLQGSKVSFDMSGGSDTRTWAGIMKQLGLDFELSTDCPPGFGDHDIAVKAAAIMQKPHFPTWHTIDGVDVMAELQETFIRFDGMADILAFHPTFQNYAKREQRKVQVILSGFAGEMYKDGGWWRVAMQTLTKSNWKQAMIQKLTYSGLVTWGFDPNMPCDLFTPDYAKLCAGYKETLYDFLMKTYNGRNRAELGDVIFNEYSIRTPRALHQKGMAYYPILLDQNILPYGLHLSFCKRLFAKEYRNLLYKADKKLARLETTKAHTSLSPQVSHMAIDMVKFFSNAFKTSVLKKKKVYPVNPLYAWIRKQTQAARYVEVVKKAGVLPAAITLEQIPDRYLGRIYSLGQLLSI